MDSIGNFNTHSNHTDMKALRFVLTTALCYMHSEKVLPQKYYH